MRRFIRASAMAIAVLWPICVSAEVQDNDRVAHKVHDLLKESGQMSGSSFVIKCQDGIACLEGRVSSEEQKALALKLTGEVEEINEVVDHLRVEPSKKAANPVVRLLSPFAKAAGQPQELPEESATAEAPRTHTSWFRNPAVRAAKSPQPKPAEPIESELTADEASDISSDDGSVFPEELPHGQAGEPGNLLVQQVANLRSIFKRSEPAKSAHVAAVSQRAPHNAARVTGECTACEGRVRSGSTARVTPVANTRRYQAASPAPGASQSSSATAGRVRMVPMVELADGSLVPVEQGRRTSTAQPTSRQRMTTASRPRTMPNSRSRQSVARKQEVIEGPMDMEPAPVPGPTMHGSANGGPLPAYVPGTAAGVAPAYYDQPHMPNYAWPSYAAHPNYAGLTYPRQYSPTAWPYIGPFYPYPQVPLGWRKVTLEWDDGWWFLDFDDTNRSYAY
jgi:hypothetical protein